MIKYISHTALVNYSQKEMYDLVNNIKDYPEFIPMCKSVVIYEHTKNNARIILNIHKGKIKIGLGTYNTMIINKEIKMNLMQGPFKTLSGIWQFIKLKNNLTKIILTMTFELDTKLFSFGLGFFIDILAKSMVDAFCKRAISLYGYKQ